MKNPQILLTNLNIFSLTVFITVLFGVLTNNYLTVYSDMYTERLLINLHDSELTSIMKYITNLLSPFIFSIISLILFTALIYFKKIYFSLLFFFSLVSGFVLEFGTKLVVHRPRPLFGLISEIGYAFPSGHATMATVFFGVLLYSFLGSIKNIFAKIFFVFGNLIFILLIGFSRLYLGVHLLSDVVGGFALGVFCITFFILIFNKFKILTHQ